MSSIDVLCQMCDGGLPVVALIIARMNVVQLDAQFIASLQVVEVTIVGLVCTSLVCMRQVDQVTPVRYDMIPLIVCMFFAVGMEAVQMLQCIFRLEVQP